MTMQVRDIRRELAADGFLTVHEAELFSGLRKSKIYSLMADGSLPYAKIGGARRVPKKALVDLLARSLVIRGEG